MFCVRKSKSLRIKMQLLNAFMKLLNSYCLSKLALSPQCGFLSTKEGNRVPYDAHLRKLQLVNEIWVDVWGEFFENNSKI